MRKTIVPILLPCIICYYHSFYQIYTYIVLEKDVDVVYSLFCHFFHFTRFHFKRMTSFYKLINYYQNYTLIMDWYFMSRCSLCYFSTQKNQHACRWPVSKFSLSNYKKIYITKEGVRFC